tara:strand:- start:5004 stop:6464 length:1461 start_codon:yes stop_codon:yes gene_type:complete
MASDIQIVQKPVNTADKVPVITNWTPAIGYMIYQDDATTASYYYYKLILEVRLDDASGLLLAKIKQRRNGYSVDVSANKARAFFDLRSIVNSQLVDTVFDQNDSGVPFRTIHKVGVNTASKPFSVNGDRNTDETQLQTIFVKGYQEYSTSASEVPQEVTTDNVTDTLYYISASLPLMTARDDDSNYIQGTAFQTYQGSGATDLFLSDVEESSGDYNITGRINYIQETDYHTIAFLNDNTNFDSDIDNIIIKYYDSSNSIIGTLKYIENNSTNGGESPTGTLTDAKRLLYFGCGAGNLEAQSVNTAARPSNFANWAYYTIQGAASSSDSYAARTKVYYFIKQDGSCKGFKVRRLAFRNSLGAYDYFNFKKKSTQTIDVNRNTYSTMLGTFNKSKWRYNNTQRGKKTRQVTAVLKETLNTDWITEQDANLLEKLIISTDVYIVENADTTYTQGVVITDSSFVKKTNANDNLIQYTIQIEYANPINTNS